MLHEPACYERLRTEVNPFMERMHDDIMGNMTHDAVKELSYVKMAYQETLRRDSPAGISSTGTVLEDITVGGVHLKPGDAFWMSMFSVHHDIEQWREPSRFVPDRFDPSYKEWYLRPNGERRAQYAWCPFFGGPRMCIGTRLAELALKTVIPLWYHFFDFEFVKHEHT